MEAPGHDLDHLRHPGAGDLHQIVGEDVDPAPLDGAEGVEIGPVGERGVGPDAGAADLRQHVENDVGVEVQKTLSGELGVGK